jgi:hypothetical protein
MESPPVPMPNYVPITPQYTGELPQFPSVYVPVVPPPEAVSTVYYHPGSIQKPPFHPIRSVFSTISWVFRHVILKIPNIVFGFIVTWLRFLAK